MRSAFEDFFDLPGIGKVRPGKNVFLAMVDSCANVNAPPGPMPSIIGGTIIGAKNSTSTFTLLRARRQRWPPNEKPQQTDARGIDLRERLGVIDRVRDRLDPGIAVCSGLLDH